MSTPAATTIRSATRIRKEFLDFFRDRHGHAFVPSSPVVPLDDPTLLFTNAGMNQFKDVFLDRGERSYTRAVNSQKCIRAGGKHNDLEDVGKDGYHHTFFEMLGNWSFGDYFKAEAIDWAWDLLTNVWGIDKDRLYVSVFAGDPGEGLEPDEEAASLWAQHVPADRISRWGKKDNFWEMGETGPCGPCSEIHFDGRSDADRAAVPGGTLVNSHPDVIEVWNLVFIQYNRAEGGQLSPLPARHVDTGMGLERLVRVLQGKTSNYDTDLWTPIFRGIEAHTGAHPYRGALDDPVDIAYRIIADHVRCLAVAINDGAAPSNEGRGYVLRRILRRAVRHAHQTLGVEGPLLCDLVPSVVESLGEAFPELARNPQHLADVIKGEELSFLRTLDRGIELFDEAAQRSTAAGVRQITAEDAFRLHDTFGFPIDLTRVMAEERGLGVDEQGYEGLMDQARTLSRRGGDTEERLTLTAEALTQLKHLGTRPTKDEDKHHGRPLSAKVEAIWNGADFDNAAAIGSPVAVILNRTNHYAEAGGQVGDRGTISTDVADAGADALRGHDARRASGDCRFVVEDTHAVGGYVLHVGRVADGTLRVGDRVTVTVSRDHRAPTEANHTGTHLLNHALREVVGEETNQRGSLVAPDRLRFDFTCAHALGDQEIERVETLVSEAIDRDMKVHAEVVLLETALRIHGVRAVFGERYPDPVRVVSIGPSVADLVAEPGNPAWHEHSIEFCGGTHLDATGATGGFVIVQEQALAAGVRRIFAVTGPAARAAMIAGRDLEARVEQAAAMDGAALVEEHEALVRLADEMTLPTLVRHRIRAKLDAMRETIRVVRRGEQSRAREDAVEQARFIAERTAAGTVIVETLAGADKDTLLPALDVLRSRCPESPALLLAPDTDAGRVAIAAVVPPSMIARGLKAGDWVREAASKCGGGGGGRPDLAQAGGRDPSRVAEAAEAARTFAEQRLG